MTDDARMTRLLKALSDLTSERGRSDLAQAMETLKKVAENGRDRWTLATVARFEKPLTPLQARAREAELRASEYDDDILGEAHFDRAGRPMSMMQWATIRKEDGYQRIAGTVVGEAYYVSTVWLGLDHSHPGQRRPIIFETMIFPLDGAPEEISGHNVSDEQWRYSTEDEALRGHEHAVAWLRDLAGQVTV